MIIYGTSSQCDWLTGRQRSNKNSKEVQSEKIRFYFWKQLTSQLLMSLDITWNYWNFHLYFHRMQLRPVIFHSAIAQNFKASGTYDYCYKPKIKQKSSKMYKYIKISKILRSLVVKVVKKPTKSLKLKVLQGLIYSSLQMGCDLCLPRLNYNSTKKLF